MKPTTQIILISVIIPAFNCEATIERCLQSLIDQTLFKNLEILVIDDGSTDRTCEIVESFAIQNTEIHLVKQTNSGPAAARNRGLDWARGEFFSFVDSDDYVDIDYFEKMLSYADETVAIVNAEANRVSADGNVVPFPSKGIVQDVAVNNTYSFFSQYSHEVVWACLYRTSKMKKIRFETDLTIGEDTVFYHRCLIAAGGCRYTDYAGYNYVQNPESITQKKSNYFKRLKDEPSAWIRVSEMFPYEKPKQTAVGIASWKLSSAVLHIGFSRELSNVAHLDAQLFKTGMRLALMTRNGKRLLQSILSHLVIRISNIIM